MIDVIRSKHVCWNHNDWFCFYVGPNPYKLGFSIGEVGLRLMLINWHVIINFDGH